MRTTPATLLDSNQINLLLEHLQNPSMQGRDIESTELPNAHEGRIPLVGNQTPAPKRCSVRNTILVALSVFVIASSGYALGETAEKSTDKIWLYEYLKNMWLLGNFVTPLGAKVLSAGFNGITNGFFLYKQLEILTNELKEFFAASCGFSKVVAKLPKIIIFTLGTAFASIPYMSINNNALENWTFYPTSLGSLAVGLASARAFWDIAVLSARGARYYLGKTTVADEEEYQYEEFCRAYGEKVLQAVQRGKPSIDSFSQSDEHNIKFHSRIKFVLTLLTIACAAIALQGYAYITGIGVVQYLVQWNLLSASEENKKIEDRCMAAFIPFFLLIVSKCNGVISDGYDHIVRRRANAIFPVDANTTRNGKWWGLAILTTVIGLGFYFLAGLTMGPAQKFNEAFMTNHTSVQFLEGISKSDTFLLTALFNGFSMNALLSEYLFPCFAQYIIASYSGNGNLKKLMQLGKSIPKELADCSPHDFQIAVEQKNLATQSFFSPHQTRLVEAQTRSAGAYAPVPGN